MKSIKLLKIPKGEQSRQKLIKPLKSGLSIVTDNNVDKYLEFSEE